MRVSRTPLALPALAATLLLLSGCGGGGNGSDAGHHTKVVGSPTATAPDAGGESGRSHTGNTVASVARSVPVRVRIPSIGLDTRLVPLALKTDGTVQVPPIEPHDPAGWYSGSPTPGQVGPAVLLGHVTVGRYGDGVFVHLGQVARGDRIAVRLKNGVTSVFTVDATQKVAKASFPTRAVYGDADHPELRLITCAGPRTGEGGAYRDNVIVYASLTSSSR